MELASPHRSVPVADKDGVMILNDWDATAYWASFEPFEAPADVAPRPEMVTETPLLYEDDY